MAPTAAATGDVAKDQAIANKNENKTAKSITASEDSHSDVDVAMENMMKDLAKTVQETALTAAAAVLDKYNKMFKDLSVAAQHSEDITNKMVKFADRFRPMNNK